MTTKTKKREPKKQTIDDKFNEIGIRDRTIADESLLVHSVSEEIDDGEVWFTIEARVMVGLEDGRALNKVVEIRFREDDQD